MRRKKFQSLALRADEYMLNAQSVMVYSESNSCCHVSSSSVKADVYGGSSLPIKKIIIKIIKIEKNEIKNEIKKLKKRKKLKKPHKITMAHECQI